MADKSHLYPWSVKGEAKNNMQQRANEMSHPLCATADIGGSVSKLAQIESNHFFSQLVMSLLLSFDLDTDYEGTHNGNIHHRWPVVYCKLWFIIEITTLAGKNVILTKKQ